MSGCRRCCRRGLLLDVRARPQSPRSCDASRAITVKRPISPCKGSRGQLEDRVSRGSGNARRVVVGWGSSRSTRHLAPRGKDKSFSVSQLLADVARGATRPTTKVASAAAEVWTLGPASSRTARPTRHYLAALPSLSYLRPRSESEPFTVLALPDHPVPVSQRCVDARCRAPAGCSGRRTRCRPDRGGCERRSSRRCF
jgi:hypothetical protein